MASLAVNGLRNMSTMFRMWLLEKLLKLISAEQYCIISQAVSCHTSVIVFPYICYLHYKSRGDTDSSAMSSISGRNRLSLQDNCWQQYDTTHILINVIHWLHRHCSAPLWFDRVTKKPSVNADLTIYTHVHGVSGSVGLMLSNKLDFSSSAIRDGFCKSSHIQGLVVQTSNTGRGDKTY